MTHTNLAKETLLQFMQAMYTWERKATRNLRDQAYKEMLKDELATIFTLRAREVSLSIRFPFDYKLETHPIVDEEHNGNQAYFYIKENHSGIETLYRFQMVFQKGKWWIDKKEWLDDGKWINSSL